MTMGRVAIGRFSCLMTICLAAGALLAAAAPAGPPSPAARRPQPIPLRDLIRSWTRPAPQLPPRAQPPEATSSMRADALSGLAGGRPIDARCATPLLLALYQNGARLNQPTRQMLDQLTRQAPAASTGSRASAGGEFVIHYTTDPRSADQVDPYDGDLNGVPDGVDRLAGELSDALADFSHVLKWPPAPPPSGSGGAVEVYLAGSFGTAGPPGGFVVPAASAWPRPGAPLEEMSEAPEGADAAIYLDSRLAAPAASSREAVAHMVAHVVLMRESARESPWWHEASASFLESRLTRDAARQAGWFSGPDAPAARGLSDDLSFVSLESFLWPHYLFQSSGSDTALLRRLWEEMAAVPGNNTFDAMDRVLRRQEGSSLAEEMRVFNIWNLFLGQADDGRHYPFASLLPTPQGDAAYEDFPVRGASLAGPVPALGVSLLRLLGDGSPGGLRIRFFGGDPGDWSVSLLVYGAGRAGDVRHVPVELDSSGRGSIPVPWRRLATIDLVIQNLAAPPAAPADYYFSVEYDPAVPYDLLGFGAEDSSGSATLTWSTDSEERLAGWNVWRSAGPLGPFARVNRYLVPGAGLAGQPMSYVYVDDSVDPGRKYYYYLEGVTLDGFTESSHTAGVRLRGAGGRAPTPR